MIMKPSSIYSQRRLEENLQKGQEAFLLQVAKKVQMAIQGAKLVTSFRQISDSLVKKKRRDTLQDIVDSAVEVLHADHVSLFYNSEGRDLMIDDGIWSNSFPKKYKNQKNRKVQFANAILLTGSKFISSREEYHKILTLESPIMSNPKNWEQSFWEKEGLQSVVGLKLELGGRNIGTMILNYKEKKDFKSSETENLLQGFPT